MPTREVTIEEIHRYTLPVLTKITEICDENYIRYFLAYGSLLGAVRHKGFIPWDDDCDILMLRPDYDRFVDYCNSHAESIYPFRLMNHQNTEGYPFGISRFCDTRFEMDRDEAGSAGMGLFVDIYPYDGMGNGKITEHLYIGFYRTYYTRMANYANLITYTSSNHKLANIIRKPMYRRAQKKGLNYYLEKLEQLARRYPFETSRYVGSIIWGLGDSHFPKEYFEENTTLVFEGLAVTVPKRYDEYLKDCYGDYMKLPPEKDRVCTHGYRLYFKE